VSLSNMPIAIKRALSAASSAEEPTAVIAGERLTATKSFPRELTLRRNGPMCAYTSKHSSRCVVIPTKRAQYPPARRYRKWFIISATPRAGLSNRTNRFSPSPRSCSLAVQNVHIGKSGPGGRRQSARHLSRRRRYRCDPLGVVHARHGGLQTDRRDAGLRSRHRARLTVKLQTHLPTP